MASAKPSSTRCLILPYASVRALTLPDLELLMPSMRRAHNSRSEMARTHCTYGIARAVLHGRIVRSALHRLRPTDRLDHRSPPARHLPVAVRLLSGVIDNSGSMATADGKRIVYGPGGREGTIESSRWAELGDALLWHAKLASAAGAPTEMRVLNPPGSNVPQVLKLGESDGDAEAEVRAVERLLTTGPTGRTPLCKQIDAVVARVREVEGALRESGQRVVVVIASDGAATDGNLEEHMKPLQSLPVWVVVRLCTDSDAVVQYWNSVDEELELDMDVLDDLTGEAAEIAEHNSWLTYGAPLHRLREWGCSHKLFDVLDEKVLHVAEMRQLVELVFGDELAAPLPSPQLDWEGFEAALQKILEEQEPTYDALRSRKCPWFDMRKLRKVYKQGAAAKSTADAGCACVLQ